MLVKFLSPFLPSVLVCTSITNVSPARILNKVSRLVVWVLGKIKLASEIVTVPSPCHHFLLLWYTFIFHGPSVNDSFFFNAAG